MRARWVLKGHWLDVLGREQTENSHLSVECIFSEVLNLLLEAGKKFFYLLVNSFRAERI